MVKKKEKYNVEGKFKIYSSSRKKKKIILKVKSLYSIWESAVNINLSNRERESLAGEFITVMLVYYSQEIQYGL